MNTPNLRNMPIEPSVRNEDLGTQFEWYHQQTGNLYATGYALAVGQAHDVIFATRMTIWRAVVRALRGIAERLLSHRNNVAVARHSMVAK